MEAPGLHETNFNTQCYKDAIGLTSRWKVRFRQTFFQNEAQKVLYKPVFVSDLISLSGWSYNLSNVRKTLKSGGGPTPITPETDQILPVGHGQEWSRMVKNVFSLKEAS